MNYRRGFTIVEIAVVVVIISILTTLSIVAYNRTQVNTRNDINRSKATIISESLEKYYERSGQYPTCTLALTGDINTVMNNIKVGDANTLTRSGRPPGTNSIVCSSTPNTTGFSYSGNSSSYTLQYIEEATGDVVKFTNRYK